jgi:hypothetical protein
MAKVCALDGLNLNDRSLYFLLRGFDPGETPLTYDEFPSYDGGVAIRNVSRAHVVQLALPIDVRATSEAARWAGIDAINAKIRLCSNDAPKTLVVGAHSYLIVDSAEARPVEDDLWYAGAARLTLTLNRRP